MSRSRMLVIDASALAGGLVGAGAYVLVKGNNIDGQPLAGATLAGLVAGIGVGVAATREWDAPALAHVPGQLMLSPTHGGAMLGWHGTL